MIKFIQKHFQRFLLFLAFSEEERRLIHSALKDMTARAEYCAKLEEEIREKTKEIEKYKRELQIADIDNSIKSDLIKELTSKLPGNEPY